MTDAADCVFCKIIAGKIPCLKLYEDDAALAFLDIGPLAEGHALLVPKRHVARVEELPTEVLAGLMRPLPALARAVANVVGVEGYNVLVNTGAVAGQVVMHVHVHVIPRKSGDGLGFRWPAGKYEPGRGEALTEQIRQAIRISESGST